MGESFLEPEVYLSSW